MFSVKTSWKNIIPPILNQPFPSPPSIFTKKFHPPPPLFYYDPLPVYENLEKQLPPAYSNP